MDKQLAQFLIAEGRPQGTMSLPQLYGFLFAVLCSPEVIEPTEWMEMIFTEADPNFKDEDEAEQITQRIIATYNEIRDELLEGTPLLPECCQPRSPAMENFATDASLAQWAQGFMDGHQWLSEVWDTHAPDELDEELGSCLLILFFFSSEALAQVLCDNVGIEDLTLEKLAETSVESFEMAMSSYAHIGSTIRQNLINESAE